MSQEPMTLVPQPGAVERTCPAAIAYDLMRDIVFEDPSRPPTNSAEFRRYLLDLYAECMLAVQGKRTRTLQRVVAAATSKVGERAMSG